MADLLDHDPHSSGHSPLHHPICRVAPRVGFSYAAHNQPGSETVLRGAFGTYYDTGQQVGGQAAQLYPHLHSNSYSYYTDKTGAARAYPFTTAALAIPSTPSAVNYGSVIGAIPNFSLPRSYQWNIAIQQAFAGKQTLTFTYVGNAGRRFLRTYTQSPNNEVLIANPNLPGVSSVVSRNDGAYGDFSNYQALQVQFQRQVPQGLRAIVNYTWSHALDTNTTDYLPVESQSQNYLLDTPGSSYGPSDNDRRHVLNIMFNYQAPHVGGMHLFGPGDETTPRVMRAAFNGWAVSGLSRAQTGGTFSVLYQKSLGPAFNYATYNYRANYNGGQVFVPSFIDSERHPRPAVWLRERQRRFPLLRHRRGVPYSSSGAAVTDSPSLFTPDNSVSVMLGSQHLGMMYFIRC